MDDPSGLINSDEAPTHHRKIVVTLSDGAKRIFIVKNNKVTINYLTTASKRADTLAYLDHATKLKVIIEPKKMQLVNAILQSLPTLVTSRLRNLKRVSFFFNGFYGYVLLKIGFSLPKMVMRDFLKVFFIQRQQ